MPNAEEQTFKGVKEVWGRDNRYVMYSNVGCFNLNLWMYSLVEVWAWEQEEEALRWTALAWDSEPRRLRIRT